ncbi:positive regulation of proteasomal ubiquitin-dependent protein catabolic process [Balamuthia mandrillaris]
MSDEAVLKVKQTFGNKWTGDVAVALASTTGWQLKEKLALCTREPPNGIKCLHAGKFLKDELTLQEQNVKPGARIMVMKERSDEEKQSIAQKEDDATKIDRLVSAATGLAERNEEEDESYYEPTTVEIYNQAGAKIQLLPGDKKALTVGMTLHDKAKTLLRTGDVKTALDLFLRADKEGFAKCSPDILSAVDNYGLLCLDIAWSYFLLQDMENLKEAKWRLQKAADCLEKSYGRDLERVRLLKGGNAGAELVLFVRLHLLEGIAAFHNGDISVAERAFNEAEKKLNILAINDEELVALVGMGFSDKEARIALRACGRDQDRAVTYIFTKREEKRQQREEERKRRHERRQQRQLGKTATGKWVNVELFQRLTKEMGFDKKLVGEALRQTDNDEFATMNLLTENTEVLRASLRRSTGGAPKQQQPVDESVVANIVAMGFSRELALGTLSHVGGNFEEAVNLLLEGKGIEAPSLPQQEEVEQQTSSPSSSSSSSTLESTKTEDKMEEEEKEKEPSEEEKQRLKEEALRKQMEEEILETVEEDAEAHLDSSLEEETAILNQYKDLLAKARSAH